MKDLIRDLRSIQAPQEVLSELERVQDSASQPLKGNERIQITDVHTLMHLEENSTFLDQEQSTKVYRSMKKPDNKLLCKRCLSLKAHNKLQHFEKQEPGGRYRPTAVANLSEHVASFDRTKIIRDIFKQVYS